MNRNNKNDICILFNAFDLFFMPNLVKIEAHF